MFIVKSPHGIAITTAARDTSYHLDYFRAILCVDKHVSPRETARYRGRRSLRTTLILRTARAASRREINIAPAGSNSAGRSSSDNSAPAICVRCRLCVQDEALPAQTCIVYPSPPPPVGVAALVNTYVETTRVRNARA